MDLHERALLLSDRIRAFDAVLDLENHNYRVLNNLARSTLESENAIDMIDRRKSWIVQVVYQEIRVGIFNYVSSAVALVNQAMRGSKTTPKKGIYELFSIKRSGNLLYRYVTDHFKNDDVHGLVLEIRNVCAHHRLPHQIISVDLASAKGKVTMPRDDFLEIGQIRDSVRRYVNTLESEIDLLALIRQHHNHLLVFHRWVHETLAELWKEEWAAINKERQKSRDAALRQFEIELREALASENADVFDRLHFTLSGVMSAHEQIQLVPLEADKKQWVARAYEAIRSRIPVSGDLDMQVRATYTEP